jgi:hypothetical protein
VSAERRRSLDFADVRSAMRTIEHQLRRRT